MSHPPARQTVEPGPLPRHRHAEGYVAVVIAGGYEEAGDSGRRRVAPGDVVVHRPWEAHLNRTPGAGAQVLNLPLLRLGLTPFGRVDDVDELVRTAGRDLIAASARLGELFRPAVSTPADWPDLLAEALADGDLHSLGGWAMRFGVSAEHLSRGFGKVFGVTPHRFRWEARSRAAIRDLTLTATPLAELALAHGFADQAHLTRSIRAFSGLTPGAWRASNRFKTAA
jgi:AraC-like DNA-binding protein